MRWGCDFVGGGGGGAEVGGGRGGMGDCLIGRRMGWMEAGGWVRRWVAGRRKG